MKVPSLSPRVLVLLLALALGLGGAGLIVALDNRGGGSEHFGASTPIRATAKTGDGSITLSWTVTKTGRGFEVLWRRHGSTDWQTAVLPPGSSSYVIANLSNGRAYDWQVVFLTGSGQSTGTATPGGGGGGPTGPTGTTGTTGTTSTTTTTTSTSTGTIGQSGYAHVVVVIEENYSGAAFESGSAYFRSLAEQGQNFTAYHGISHPSEPNYLGLLSGSTQGQDGSDSCISSGSKSLVGELVNAGVSVQSYAEGLNGGSGYACRHDPFSQFSDARSHDVDFSSFPTTAAGYSALPQLSVVIPNLTDDAHDSNPATAGTWALGHLDGLVLWAKSNDSLVLFMSDENDSDPHYGSNEPGENGNDAMMIAVGQGVAAGTSSGTNFDHYSTLRTLEDIYGVAPLGSSAQASDLLPVAPPSTSTTTTSTSTSTPSTTTSTSSTSTSTTSTATGGNVNPIGPSGAWKSVMDTEFTGSSLPSPWSTGWFGSGITQGVGGSGENDCYDPAQVSVGNGELDLGVVKKTESCGGSSHQYATGFITTDGTFSYTYGYIESRMWLPGNGSIADWPGWWTDGQSWPQNGELDVMEGLDGVACAHWHGPPQGVGYGTNGGDGCAPGTFTGGWHTFGADWEPGKVTWYYDGQNIGCVESSGSDCGGSNHDTQITGFPMYLILGIGAGSNTVAPVTWKIDYVRVWQHAAALRYRLRRHVVHGHSVHATRATERGSHPSHGHI